ncbi:hypothetical protein GCM10020360_30170 [Nonlabens tegetincola]
MSVPGGALPGGALSDGALSDGALSDGALSDGAPVPGGSVFLAALGPAAALLHPEVRRYAAGAGVVGGAVSVTGEFSVAGSRYRWLNLLARPIVGPELFVTAHERGVPFAVVNTVVRVGDGAGVGDSVRGGDGVLGSDGVRENDGVRGGSVAVSPRSAPAGCQVGLQAERVFVFRRGEQRFVDVLLPGERPGTLRNLLGRDRRVELELRCSVTAEGHLRLVSERAWLRLGRLRMRLPSLLSVRADVSDGFDDASNRNTVAARVRSPLLGTVLEYRGSFTHAALTGAAPIGSPGSDCPETQ